MLVTNLTKFFSSVKKSYFYLKSYNRQFMGKPFRKELSQINDTLDWANSVSLNELSDELDTLLSAPTFIVGSGGSISACHFLSLILQNLGGFAKSITPLELFYQSNSIRNCNIIFISASGRNSDILFAYNTAIKLNPKRIVGICMKKNTKLAALATKHSTSKIIELNTPSGKDGFLATNSLVSYFGILARLQEKIKAIEKISISEKTENEISEFVKQLYTDFTITVLYAGWSQPVAIDLESKFTEAGLGNILFTDFRNFGHGRHNWFDKKKKQSAIVALVSPTEKELAEKTLSLLPKEIPKLIISSSNTFSNSSIELLIQSFYLVDAVGKKCGIDPGRPGVPSYGSKLYNLRYQSLLESKVDNKMISSIIQKSGVKLFDDLSDVEKKDWVLKYNAYLKKLNTAKFGSLILDYDGTLCTKEERKSPPKDVVSNLLNSFLKKGFILGIVTGRGKSVRESLEKCIDKKYWGNVLIGYYNGAIVAPLSDSSEPKITQKPKQQLQAIYDLVKKIKFYGELPVLTLRPFQLSIECGNPKKWNYQKANILETIANQKINSIEILESGHSIDIIAKPEVSKINIINPCVDMCLKNGISTQYLCIGDKGKFPGNDYELLQSEYSLSVDEVSFNSDSCWNISEIGNRGVSTLVSYLETAKFDKSHFSLFV